MGPSWRSRGLEAAAKLTGLTFDIPPQPQNPQPFVEAFRGIGFRVRVIGARDEDGDGDGGNKKRATAIRPNLGAAKAWIAHLDLLKYVVAAGFETAFIVEDDVDFDVRIKAQMRLVSENVREYTRGDASLSSPPSSLDYDDSDEDGEEDEDGGDNKDNKDNMDNMDDGTPFGTVWDVLWLGHCGAEIDDDSVKQPLSYADPTRCPADLYVGWWTANLEAHVPAGHRVVQDAGPRTVCTFGYGVTRRSAQKILVALGGGAHEAFDVLLAARCREGSLRCLVVNPQLFQHYEPLVAAGAGDGIAQGSNRSTSLVRVGNGEDTRADEAVFEARPGSTANIVLSARCQALFGTPCLRGPKR
ncbi:glycosyltransferase family 25 protein [Nemania sp. NC0429]|nr:glycosyltransferase family 25 protein [Nemania sp. NC0429]